MPEGVDADDVEAFFRRASLSVRTVSPREAEARGAVWIAAHSTPVNAIGRVELEAFLSAFRSHAGAPAQQVAPTTERRMVADLRQCWGWAVEQERIETNPWDRVKLRSKVAGSARLRTGKAALEADADLVLSPEQVWAMARACVEEGSWDGGVECFVLVMGFCGLRPNEAVGLVVGDLELPPVATGWLTVRRNRRLVPDRYLDAEEDPEWGPLKGRDLADNRRVPIPVEVAALLRHHLSTYCGDASPHDLAFRRRDKPYELRAFSTDVWHPARTSLFPLVAGLDPASPLQPKLARLRRHDLRHSACSLWLRAGVDVTVCQRWSGHKRLSVFLDIYQGLIPGREAEGTRLLEAALATGLKPGVPD